MDDEILFGAKRITPTNLLMPDISRLHASDEAVWISYFASPKLDDAVPKPVQRLFELARGAMVYGWLYYPLLTAGYIECTKVLEAAARHAAAEVGSRQAGCGAARDVRDDLGSTTRKWADQERRRLGAVDARSKDPKRLRASN